MLWTYTRPHWNDERRRGGISPLACALVETADPRMFNRIEVEPGFPLSPFEPISPYCTLAQYRKGFEYLPRSADEAANFTISSAHFDAKSFVLDPPECRVP